MMPEIRQEGDTMGEFLGKRVIPRHEGDWDKARSYEPLMIVLLSVIVGAILLSVMLPLMGVMSSIG